MHLDHDRQGIPGSPDLARVILEKIEQSAVFIADVTPVGAVTIQSGKETPKKVINPNVAIELGYALHALTDQALLMVMNECYGTRADLPFDLQSKAGPIMFTLAPDADRQTILAASRQLTARFVDALKPFIAERVKDIQQSRPFPAAEAKNGPARFRAAGGSIGNRWELLPFGSHSGHSICLSDGAATWLRLMPTFDPGKTWTAQELRDASSKGHIVLLPFIFSDIYPVRAADGIGICNLLTAQDQETNSIAFAFETGEVWAIDTWALGTDSSKLFVQEIERGWTECLKGYGSLLQRLGLNGPYRWIAGVAGVYHRLLEYPTPQGRARFPGWQGPECLSEQIIIEGSYDGQQSTANALLPFFEAIYNKCGIRRPDYLPK